MSDMEQNVQMELEDGYGETMETLPGTQHEFIHVPSADIKCEVDLDDVVYEEPTHFAPDDPLNCHFMLATEEPSSSRLVTSRPTSNDQQSSGSMQEIQVCIKRASGAITTTPMRIPKDGDIMTHLMSRINTNTNPQLANKVKITLNNSESGEKQTFYYNTPREKTTKCEVEGCKWKTKESDPDRVLDLLKQHLLRSHQNMSMCQYCTNLFETRLELTHHINKFHVTYVCSLCFTRFESNRELCLHQLKCRDASQNNSPAPPESNNEIPQGQSVVIQQSNSVEIPQRQSVVIPQNKSVEIPRRKNINILKSNTQATKVVCKIPEQKKKQRRKPLNTTYRCKVSDCPWFNCVTNPNLAQSQLRFHIRKAHPNVFMCVCLSLYPSRKSFIQHITHCKKLFPCNDCPMTFAKSQELYIHCVDVHSYYCNDEEDETPSRTCNNNDCTWKVQNITLKGESLIEMKLHSICEHGSVNICEICMHMFNNKQQLLLHFSKNHDQIRCPHSPRRKFKTDKGLDEHIRRYHYRTLISSAKESVFSDHDSSMDGVEILDSLSETDRIEAEIVSIASNSSENDDSMSLTSFRNETVASTSTISVKYEAVASPIPSTYDELSTGSISNEAPVTDTSSISVKNEAVASTLWSNSTYGETSTSSSRYETVTSTSTSSLKNKVVTPTVATSIQLSISTTGTSRNEAVASTLLHNSTLGEIKNEDNAQLRTKGVKSKTYPPSFVLCQMELCEYATDGTNKKKAVFNMKNHTALHHNHLHICDTCFSLFTTKKELMIHSVQAHVTYNCQFCRSKFDNVDDLAIHKVKYHENAKVGSRVTTRTRAAEISLNGMVNTPNNEKPANKLTWCSMSDCMWSTDATETEEILTNIKCHASFVHNKNHVCEHCFSLFDILFDCLNHINEEHLKLCNICSFKYVTSEELNEHLIHAHLVPNNVPVKRLGPIERSEHRLSSGTFMCKICFCTLNNYDKFQQHCVDCHTVTSDLNMDEIKNKDCLVYKKYRCKKCRCAMQNFSKLGQHLVHYHSMAGAIIPLLDKGIRECYACPFRKRSCTFQKWIPSKEALGNHFRTFHGLSDEEFPPLVINCVNPDDWFTTIIFEQPVNYKYKSRYECQYCIDIFHTLNDIHEHFKVKHDKHRCSKCLTMFDSKKEVLQHDKEVHVATCMLCDFTAIRHQTMMSHMSKTHKDVDPSLWNVETTTSTSNLACKLCRQPFTTSLNAKMHYFYYHSRYACDFCWLSFNQSSQEEQHFNQNHLTECRYCRRKFQLREDLMFHLGAEHPEDQGPLCESCGEYVVDRETLLKHRGDHGKPLTVDKKPWQISALCNLCGMTLTNQHSLDLHMISKHTENDERSGNFCKICNKQYKSIQMHMYKTHGAASVKTMNKEMKFKCPHCPKIFMTYFDLKRHLPRHSKYTCKLCPMQFNFLPNLEEHVKELHTNPFAYSCGVCNNKVFATNSDYQLHLGFHSPKSSQDVSPKLLPYWRCQLCDQFCLSQEAIKKHIKTHHIRGRKLVNVKKCKAKGRKPYLKRV